MALGISYKRLGLGVGEPGKPGQVKYVAVRFLGDTDIPAAGTGYTITAASLGLVRFEDGGHQVTGGGPAGEYVPTFNVLAGNATATLRFFLAATGVEAAANEDGVLNEVVHGLILGTTR